MTQLAGWPAVAARRDVLGAYPGGIDTDMLAGVEAPKAPPPPATST